MYAKKSKNFKLLNINDYPEDKWEKLGIVVKKPEYSTGLYKTDYFRVTEGELKLFEHLKLRKDTFNLDKAIEIALKDSNFRDLLDKELTNEKLMLEIFDRLKNILKLENDTPMMDPKYYSEYNQKIGLKVAIDGFHNLLSKNFYFCFFSIFPPGKFYYENPDLT